MSSPYLPFLYAALAEPFGVVLSVSNVGQAKAALYKARAESGDEALSQVSIHSSPSQPDSEIWLVKRRKQDKDPPNAKTGK